MVKEHSFFVSDPFNNPFSNLFQHELFPSHSFPVLNVLNGEIVSVPAKCTILLKATDKKKLADINRDSIKEKLKKDKQLILVIISSSLMFILSILLPLFKPSTTDNTIISFVMGAIGLLLLVIVVNVIVFDSSNYQYEITKNISREPTKDYIVAETESIDNDLDLYKTDIESARRKFSKPYLHYLKLKSESTDNQNC